MSIVGANYIRFVLIEMDIYILIYKSEITAP